MIDEGTAMRPGPHPEAADHPPPGPDYAAAWTRELRRARVMGFGPIIAGYAVGVVALFAIGEFPAWWGTVLFLGLAGLGPLGTALMWLNMRQRAWPAATVIAWERRHAAQVAASAADGASAADVEAPDAVKALLDEARRRLVVGADPFPPLVKAHRLLGPRARQYESEEDRRDRRRTTWQLALWSLIPAVIVFVLAWLGLHSW